MSKSRDPIVGRFGTYEKITKKENLEKKKKDIEENVGQMKAKLEREFGTPMDHAKKFIDTSIPPQTSLRIRSNRTSISTPDVSKSSRILPTCGSKKIDTSSPI